MEKNDIIKLINVRIIVIVIVYFVLLSILKVMQVYFLMQFTCLFFYCLATVFTQSSPIQTITQGIQ